MPALAGGGGVPAVAEFLCAQIERSGRYALKVFSLPTSSRDACSLRLLAPDTWLTCPRSTTGTWNGREFIHFGTVGVELEFQRLKPTSLLSAALQTCDLIQVVSGSPAPALATLGCNKPVVLQVATRAAVERRKALTVGSAPARMWRALMTRIVSHCESRVLRSVDAVMVENEWMLHHALQTVGRRSTVVVNAPPGIDCEELSPGETRLATMESAPYILFVGRMSDPRKNISLLCRAYVLLCKRLQKPPQLVIAGQGDELPLNAKGALSDLSPSGCVRIVNEPTSVQLRDLYRDATCLALSSDEEGLGLVVIEAMACGVPAVATRCGGPDTVISHGVDGFLVPLEDPEQLAQHLWILCSQRELNIGMGIQARKAVLSRFSADIAFRPFTEIYERLLSRRTLH
ncbi:MAG TPA: glycosyltransferase [Paraburkholderia sp.]|uniref:glycosyltransferase family 4 protein n=1 Tax=Paraburkholderia sp. TaxID=1926495 RepID=UPI002B459545|nr:glycosyltransferase [Paraburkholderia sp.]HKR41465.1 glycosyltransferase [Paraburkholderia sp.]